MNAPTGLHPRSQALRDCCRQRRWELLQLFGEVEIALARQLETQTPTFGAKLRAVTKSLPELGKFKTVNAARNLLAHAHVTISECDEEVVSLWRTADASNELNCLVLNRKDFEQWAKHLAKDLASCLKILGAKKPPA